MPAAVGARKVVGEYVGVFGNWDYVDLWD